MVKIGQGHVYYSRLEGFANSFRYPTFFLHFDCDSEAKLQNMLRTRFLKLLSISSENYLDFRKGELDFNIKAFLLEHCAFSAARVELQTLPKMLGYGFNPVTFWLCYRDDLLEACLIEVNNTFGEKHFYWLNPPGGIEAAKWYDTTKVFHVSPFLPIEGFYRFRFLVNAEQSRIDINYFGPDEKLRLATWVQGQFSRLEDTSVTGLFARYGWMTLLVVVRIHYQALRLLLKRNRFYSKPECPAKKVTL